MAVEVRRATKEDYPGIKEMLNGLDDRDRYLLALNNKDKHRSVMAAARSGKHCYVADKDGSVVGFMSESGRPGNSSYLEEFVVHPKHRGQGIATSMLETYHSEFPSTTAKTKPDNEAMKHLLKSHGYSVVDPNAKHVLNWERGVNKIGEDMSYLIGSGMIKTAGVGSSIKDFISNAGRKLMPGLDRFAYRAKEALKARRKAINAINKEYKGTGLKPNEQAMFGGQFKAMRDAWKRSGEEYAKRYGGEGGKRYIGKDMLADLSK